MKVPGPRRGDDLDLIKMSVTACGISARHPHDLLAGGDAGGTVVRRVLLR
jgi:hypothetical protein